MIQIVAVTPKQIQVVLSGELCTAEAKMIRESLTGYIDSGNSSISIDLSQVDHIDRNGLGALVFIHLRADEKQGRFVIRGLQGKLKELFELARLDKVFYIE